MAKAERTGAGRKSNNRGMTLVELLVASAILAVVVGIGMTFVVHATNIFNRGNGESNMQNEAQLTMARLQSLIVNATHGVSIKEPVVGGGVDPNTEGGDTGTSLYVYNRTESAPVGTGSAYNVVSYTVTHIYRANDQLMYEVKNYVPDTNHAGQFVLEASPEGAKVLADYVDDFEVDLSDFAAKRSVKLTLGLKNQAQSFEMTNTFLMRNAISKNINGSADDYFKSDAVEDGQDKIKKISLSPADQHMWAGSALASPFTAQALVGEDTNWKLGIPVIWSMEAGDGTAASDATINRTTGTIQVGPDVYGSLRVYATAQSSVNQGGADSGRYISNEQAAIVYVKSFDSVDFQHDPSAVSDADHTMYETVFEVNGHYLEDTDVLANPYVVPGESNVTATFEKLTQGGGNTVQWKVLIRRPAGYKDRTNKLEVGYKLNGKTLTAKFDNIIFEASDEEKNQTSAEVRLWDKTAGVAYAMGGMERVDGSMRGSTRELQLQMNYGDGNWVTQDCNDWSITCDNSDVRITQGGGSYQVALSVKNYAGTEDITLTTKYTDNSGANADGPKVQFRCPPVSIQLVGVTGNSQMTFPVAKGVTEQLSFKINNLDGASAFLIESKSDESNGSTMRVSVSGERASVAVSSAQSAPRKYCFGVCTADGEELPDSVCCELTFIPNNKNVYADTGGTLSNLFLPRPGDLTNYSSQITAPGEGEETLLYTAGGKKAVYSRTGGKDYVVYDGRKYVYDSRWRGWVPV